MFHSRCAGCFLVFCWHVRHQRKAHGIIILHPLTGRLQQDALGQRPDQKRVPVRHRHHEDRHLQNQSLTSSLPLAPAPWHPWKVGHTSGHTHTQKTQPPPLMPTTLPRPPPLTASLPAPPAPPLPGPPLARHYRSCPDHTCPCCQRFLRQLYAHSRACNGCCCSLACLHAKAQQCGVPATPRSLECVRTLMGMGRSCSSS